MNLNPVLKRVYFYVHLCGIEMLMQGYPTVQPLYLHDVGQVPGAALITQQLEVDVFCLSY